MTAALAAALWQFQDLTITDPTSDSGRCAPLGRRARLEANEADTVLAVLVTSTGAVAGGESFLRTSTYKSSPASYTAYTVPGDSGDQVWVYVANETGSTINRGTPLKYNTSSTVGPYSVAPLAAGDHPDEVIGVAQWDIATAKAGWVACDGWAQVTIGGAGTTEGEAVEFGTTGGALDVASVGVPSNGRAYTTAATGLAEVILTCRR